MVLVPLFLLSSFLLQFTCALPLRKVRDYLGTAWEEYFDETTHHFYYYNPASGSTSWILEFSPNRDGIFGASVATQSNDVPKKSRKTAFTRSNNPWESFADNIIEDASRIAPKKVSSTGRMPLYPEDRHTLHLLMDPAGKLRKKHIFTVFDVLRGVRSRVNFPVALKAPVAFHHMFVSENSDRSSVALERWRIEAQVEAHPDSGESWESLGHVWRVYGDVERTIDCYRRALELGPSDKPSLYINLAGILDQMNYIQDAMQVLQTMLDVVDVFSVETEANIALGYIMAAQLHVRDRNFSQATEMVDAAIELQPSFHAAIVGLRQEMHYRYCAKGCVSDLTAAATIIRNYSFGGPPWLLGGMGSWVNEKNPWIMFQAVSSTLVFLSGGYLASTEALVVCLGTRFPQLTLLARKVTNALPAVAGGLLARKTAASGAMVTMGGLSVPTLLPMALLTVASSLTEYLVVDCMFLMIAGALLGLESWVEKRVLRLL